MDEADRKLWDLLGRAASPTAPPFFAGKVMRQIEAGPGNAGDWLGTALRWLAPATIATLFVVALLPRPTPGEARTASTEITTLDLVEIVNPNDYEVLTTAGWPYDNGLLTAGL
ncbi:MAG: hypothetical protein ACOYOL_09270 [Chthoniobacterales bacterium]